MAQSVGTALAFIIIPLISDTSDYDIHTMLYVQAELGLYICSTAGHHLLPSAFPRPSAGTERTKFWSSLKALMCNRAAFLVLAVSGGLTAGGNRYVMFYPQIWLDHWILEGPPGLGPGAHECPKSASHDSWTPGSPQETLKQPSKQRDYICWWRLMIIT